MYKITRLLKPAPILTEQVLHTLTYPLILQPKYDGIRCFLANGRTYTNPLKHIPNNHIRNHLSQFTSGPWVGCMWDGEILLRNTKDYNEVQSAVMTRLGEPDFKYVIFDCDMAGSGGANDKQGDWFRGGGYEQRIHWAAQQRFSVEARLVSTPWRMVKKVEDVLYYEKLLLEQGYEGIILRSPDGHYKQGRSTLNEQICLKFKRTEDAEARIIKLNEALHNRNEATTDARGLTKRSSHQHNKVGAGRLGSFTVEGINGRYKGKIFDVAPGCLTHEDCERIWSRHPMYYEAGEEIITYKYDKTRGKEDGLPANARFKCFRKDGI